MHGIKISQLNEKKIKNNDDYFEISTNFQSYKIKRRNVLELDANSFVGPTFLDCSSNSIYHFRYDFVDVENEFYDLVLVDPDNFQSEFDNSPVYYFLSLPSANNFDFGYELKIVLTGDPEKGGEDRFVIGIELSDNVAPSELFIYPNVDTTSNTTNNLIMDLSSYGFVSLMCSKDENSNKKWFILDSTGENTGTICDVL